MCFDTKTITVLDLAKKVKPLPGISAELTSAQEKTTVVGWRGWTIEGEFDPVLVSFLAGGRPPWRPGKIMDSHQDVESAKTGVGVHAWKTLDECLRYLKNAKGGWGTDNKLSVIGEVLLWGKVAEHSDGYRAEHGYPLRLWVNSPALQIKLRNKYDVWVGRAFIPRLIEDRKAA